MEAHRVKEETIASFSPVLAKRTFIEGTSQSKISLFPTTPGTVVPSGKYQR
jgi:hypothetical protein